MRPRRVGEVLDAAIKIYLRNARTLMGATAAVVIPLRLLAGIVLLSVLPNGNDVPGGTFNLNSNSQPAADRAAVLGANGALIVIELIVATLVVAACTKAVSDAAGTIVTREQPVAKANARTAGRAPAPASVESGERWDTSAITTQEVAAVRRFLERRASLERGARRELGARLADGLRSKVTSAPADLGPEQFLEELERIKRTR